MPPGPAMPPMMPGMPPGQCYGQSLGIKLLKCTSLHKKLTVIIFSDENFNSALVKNKILLIKLFILFRVLCS